MSMPYKVNLISISVSVNYNRGAPTAPARMCWALGISKALGLWWSLKQVSWLFSTGFPSIPLPHSFQECARHMHAGHTSHEGRGLGRHHLQLHYLVCSILRTACRDASEKRWLFHSGERQPPTPQSWCEGCTVLCDLRLALRKWRSRTPKALFCTWQRTHRHSDILCWPLSQIFADNGASPWRSVPNPHGPPRHLATSFSISRISLPL